MRLQLEQPERPVEIWGGMECTINRVHDNYFDQLSYSGHRERSGDIELFAGLGLKKIRYPVLWEHHQPEVNAPIYWEETESKLQLLRAHNIDIIAGLVHHGSGPAHVDIREESFILGLAAYAGAVAKKFPWINYYTPVNEPLTTARFCGLYGHWHPHEKNDQCFCRILVNECKATIMAMLQIQKVNPLAKLVQTDDLGKAHSSPVLTYQADFENHRRWLTFDLLCGKVDTNHGLWNYLVENGITPEELTYFLSNPFPPSVLGINYYLTSERYLDEALENYPAHTYGGNGKHVYADVEAVRVGGVKPDGLGRLLQAAWERYDIPIAVTEVHLHCTREEQMRWLEHVWQTACDLKNRNVPILAITPWALLGSFGWDRLLTCSRGNYEPGIFNLSSGQPRPTILAAMLAAYSQNRKFDHPAFAMPGWWERSSRAAYGKDRFSPELVPSGRLLMLAGRYAADLAIICHTRGLNYCDGPAVHLPDDAIWAKVIVNEYMEVICPGRSDLIIRLSGHDHFSVLNAGLDLFIDGESGQWNITWDGNLHEYKADVSHALQNLAG